MGFRRNLHRFAWRKIYVKQTNFDILVRIAGSEAVSFTLFLDNYRSMVMYFGSF